MALVNIRNASVVEPDSSRVDMIFEVELPVASTAPVSLRYFLVSNTASGVAGDFSTNTFTGITIPAGETSAEIIIEARRDDLVEGDETFSLVVFANQNAEFADAAAALIATGTIYDNDDSGSDPAGGPGDFAAPLFGPTSESNLFPTLDVRSITLDEGTTTSDGDAHFLITLDRPATAAVTGRVTTIGETASVSDGDFSDSLGAFTILPGQQSALVSIGVDADSDVEPDETFQLLVSDVFNAVLPDNAAALVATATILDDDNGDPGAGGIGDFSEKISGPSSADANLPTLRVHDAAIVESDSLGVNTRLEFLVTLDQPVTTQVTFTYTVNSETAEANVTSIFSGGDATQVTSIGVIAPGRQSTFVSVPVRGDFAIEGDETINLVLSTIQNAVFEGNATALLATGTILDNNSGPITGPAGIGAPGKLIDSPDSTSSSVVVDILDVKIIESNVQGVAFANVYVLLSEPSLTTIRFDLETVDGTATAGFDYVAESESITVNPGLTSFFLPIRITGDNNIEGDEAFTVRLSNLQGAVFANGQSTMSATVDIIGNDGAGSSDTIDASELGPDFSFFVAPINGTSGDDLLPGTSAGETINGFGGNDEIFGGAGNDRIFSGKGNDTVFGGDGNDVIRAGGGAESFFGGAGKDYISYYDSSNGVNINLATDTVSGSWAVNDVIDSFESAAGSRTGDDSIIGTSGSNTIRTYGGDDRVAAGGGSDKVELGDGNDYVRVGGGQESFYGGDGKDWISYYDSSNGVNVNLATNTVSGSWAVNDIVEDFESVSGSRTGDDSIIGTSGSNTIKTYGGDDRVAAGGGTDVVELGSGNDYVRVGGGKETFDGGSGTDYISYFDSSNGIRIDLRDDEVSGSWAVNDTIKDFEGASGSGTGDDVMLGTNGANSLRGFGGDDKLYGRGGGDKLYGGSGEDFLDGGGGSGTDLLYGGSGADVFEFDRGEGTDIIKDFENNIDQINLDGFNFSTADAYDFAEQVGSDVVFDFGSDGMLTIEDTTIGRLQNDLDVV